MWWVLRCGDVTISLVLALGLTQQDCNVVMRDSNVKRLAHHWEDTDEMRGGNLLVARTCEDHDDLTITNPSPPMVTTGANTAKMLRVITRVTASGWIVTVTILLQLPVSFTEVRISWDNPENISRLKHSRPPSLVVTTQHPGVHSHFVPGD